MSLAAFKKMAENVDTSKLGDFAEQAEGMAKKAASNSGIDTKNMGVPQLGDMAPPNLSTLAPLATAPEATAPAQENNADIKMSANDLKEIENHIDGVMKQYLTPEIIGNAIVNYINTLQPEGEFDVNRIMLNVVFSQIDLLQQPLNNYKLMDQLLINKDITAIVNDAISYCKDHPSTLFLESLKLNVFLKKNGVPSQPQMGGKGTTEPPKTEEDKANAVVLTKMERLFQMDLPNDKILNMFYSYIENFFKGESPEKMKIFKSLTNKVDEFIGVLFTNSAFNGLEFHKYLFLALLQNKDIASKIKDITFIGNDKLASLQKTFRDLVVPPAPTPTPSTVKGGKRRKKTLNRKGKGAKKHKRTINKRRV